MAAIYERDGLLGLSREDDPSPWKLSSLSLRPALVTCLASHSEAWNKGEPRHLLFPIAIGLCFQEPRCFVAISSLWVVAKAGVIVCEELAMFTYFYSISKNGNVALTRMIPTSKAPVTRSVSKFTRMQALALAQEKGQLSL